MVVTVYIIPTTKFLYFSVNLNILKIAYPVKIMFWGKIVKKINVSSYNTMFSSRTEIYECL